MAAASETVAVRERGSLLGARTREALWGYGFVVVPMAVFGLFFVYPFGYAIYISLYKWGILGKDHTAANPASLHNYGNVLHDPVFHTAIKNTLEYAAAQVPLIMAVGLTLALIVNSALRGKAFFRSAFYFPSIASSVAIMTIALFLFNIDGLFNHVFGLHISWFTQQSTVLWSIVGVNTWTTSATVMLWYLAALQSIPTDVYEAAALDGTHWWRRFWRITFPLLRPAHFFVLVVFGVGALKIFDQAFLASGGTGGPNYASTTAVLYIYREAFKVFDFGVAAAAGTVLFAIIFLLTALSRVTVGRGEAT